MDVDTHRQMEDQGTGQLLHIEFAVTIVSTFFGSGKDVQATNLVLVSLNIPVIFNEHRHKVHEVDFCSSTHERERHIVSIGRIAVTTVQVQQERKTVATIKFASIHRDCKTTLNRGVLGTKRISNTVFLIDIFGFANPKALLVYVGRTGSNTAKHGTSSQP